MGWVKKLRVPAVTVPYFAGWELARKPVRVRLRVDCVTEEGSSVNVIGRLRGSRRGAKGILIGAHHDSIAIGQSADDNATGVACVIEIAKALARADRKRDVWAVTFGCEENLSVGAEAFVRKQEFGASRLAAMINFDSCGSLLGRTHALVTGPPQMRHWVTKQLRQLGKQIQVQPDVSPYSDHFFFAAAGVPAIWFHRTNCAAGRWYHHQSEDTVEVIGQEALQTVALAGLALADRLSRAEKLPYRCLVPGEQLERARLLERAMACWPPT
jgi:Zn-dependent M28 family amino/carboxypeptidase